MAEPQNPYDIPRPGRITTQEILDRHFKKPDKSSFSVPIFRDDSWLNPFRKTIPIDGWDGGSPSIPNKQPGESDESFNARLKAARDSYGSSVTGAAAKKTNEVLYPGAAKAAADEAAADQKYRDDLIKKNTPLTPEQVINIQKQALNDQTNSQIQVNNQAAGNRIKETLINNTFTKGENQAARTQQTNLTTLGFGQTIKLRDIDQTNALELNKVGFGQTVQLRGIDQANAVANAILTHNQIKDLRGIDFGNQTKLNTALYGHQEKGWKIDDARLRRGQTLDFLSNNALKPSDILRAF